MNVNTSAPASQDNSALPDHSHDITSPADPGAPLTPSASASPYARAMHIFRAEGRVTDNLMYECASLGVSSLALAAVASGYYPLRTNAARPGVRIPKAEMAGGDYCALPMSDADGDTVGIQLVPYTGKAVLTVGKPGLIVPTTGYHYPGIVVVTHSALDALALLTVGISAVAVMDPEGDSEQVYKWLQRLGQERGVFIVGKDTWSKRLEMYLKENDLGWVWRTYPPDGFSNLHAWVVNDLKNITDEAGLATLGDQLAGILEANAAKPRDQSHILPCVPAADLLLTLSGAVVDALMGAAPSYRQYLSEAARVRGVIWQEEMEAARMAAWAAECNDPEDVARWVEVGKCVSMAVDDQRHANSRAAQQPTATTEPDKTDAHRYTVTGGQICCRSWNRAGETEDEPLCNFDARILEEIIHDDGAETTTYFRIAGYLRDGTPLPPIEVRADEYAEMDWVTAQWGARPIINVVAAARNHLRAAIQHFSGVVARHTVYGHAGWREIEGRQHYLHAGGAIHSFGPASGIAVRLPDALTRFQLPVPPTGLTLVQAIRASLRMLPVESSGSQDLAPDRISYPLYAAIWSAVLGGSDKSLALNGFTGTFKSELAALAQRHFGAGMDARHLPANWSSTSNALEAVAHAAKDALLVVDDYCPPGGPEAARYHAKADQVLRGAGNGAGRQRMRADTTLRPEKPPRCLILSTGEESPRGQSLQARMLQNDVVQGDVDVERLTECQRDAAAGLYAQTLAAFVRWVAPQYEALKEKMRSEVEEKRALAFRHGQHRRTPGIVAELAVALSWFLRFAHQAGAVTAREVKAYEARCEEALGIAAGKQTDDQQAEQPTRKFLRLLAAAIASGRAHVAGVEGGVPAIGATLEDRVLNPIGMAWGWRSDRAGLWEPQGQRVGWLDGDNLYLEPNASYAVAQTLARDQADGLPVGPRTMWKRLREERLLFIENEKRGSTVRKSLAGVSERPVLHLLASSVTSGVPTQIIEGNLFDGLDA